MAVAATCAAPAVPLAQAIGRWGNYFNKELYGRPTSLPWGLEIDADHLEAGYAVGTTFHPTFLYESLWCLALCFVLLWIDRRFRPAPALAHLLGMGSPAAFDRPSSMAENISATPFIGLPCHDSYTALFMPTLAPAMLSNGRLIPSNTGSVPRMVAAS